MKRTDMNGRTHRVALLVLIIIGVLTIAYIGAAKNASTWEKRSVEAAADAKKSQALAASKKQLQDITSTMAATYGDDIGLAVVDLSNDVSDTTNANTQFVTASTYKLYVAYDVYKQIDAGTVSYSQKLTQYGTSQTVEACLEEMITISDNTCGIALGRLDGWSKLDKLLASEGYTDTMLDNYTASGALYGDKQTTANDLALLLTRLYRGTLLSKDSTAQFIKLLKADEIDYMLPSGFPDGTVIADKVGFLGQYQNDAGIIYSAKKDMVVVMLTKGWPSSPEAHATTAFTTLGQSVWSYMQK